jgi:hypothetical protein
MSLRPRSELVPCILVFVYLYFITVQMNYQSLKVNILMTNLLSLYTQRQEFCTWNALCALQLSRRYVSQLLFC